MTKYRLDHLMVARELVTTRSQAESYIRLGVVKVDGKVQTKPGFFVRGKFFAGISRRLCRSTLFRGGQRSARRF